MTICPYATNFCLFSGILLWGRKIVSVMFTLPPTPCVNYPILFTNYLTHTGLCIDLCMICLYSDADPVSSSMIVFAVISSYS